MITPAKNTQTLLILILAVSVASMIIAAFICNFCIPFLKQKKYLKMEIHRSDGEERKYWERQLKIFYASHIPLVRHFIYKKRKRM